MMEILSLTGSSHYSRNSPHKRQILDCKTEIDKYLLDYIRKWIYSFEWYVTDMRIQVAITFDFIRSKEKYLGESLWQA